MLLIEDNPGDVDLVQVLLREAPGCFIEVACASGLESGLAAIRSAEFDAVIADLTLPDASPTQTLFRIRQTGQTLPILVLSGCDNEALRRDARAAGVQDFLVKGEPETLGLCSRLLGAVEQYRAEGAQRQLERWISVVPDAVIVTSEEGELEFVNQSALDLLGLTESELREQRLCFSLKEGGTTELDILRDQPHFGEMRVVSVDWHGTPASLAVIRDTTAERMTDPTQLLADQLCSIGGMAASAAHELNNPLGALLVNLQLAERAVKSASHPPELALLPELLADARDAAERVRTLVGDLRALARTGQALTSGVDVASVVERSLRLASHATRKHARVLVEYEPDLPLVQGHESGLGQVVYNLVVRAASALGPGIPDRNCITVAARRADPHWVELAIEHRRWDADPDARAKSAARDSSSSNSLPPDLVASRRIVASYGGSIDVERWRDGGARVRLFLRASDPSAPSSNVVRMRQPRANRGRVLLIDDDAALATALSRALRVQHDVMVAHGGQEALELLRRDADFDIVFCDVSMPGMSGTQLFEALENELPELTAKLAFFTGGACSTKESELLDRIPNPKLDKPLNIERVLSLIDAALRC